MEELERLSEDKYFGALYDNTVVQRKLENSAFDLGEQKGIEEGKIESTMSLIKNNFPKEEIIKLLNISEEIYNEAQQRVEKEE